MKTGDVSLKLTYEEQNLPYRRTLAGKPARPGRGKLETPNAARADKN
jgi:hypothetical protein